MSTYQYFTTYTSTTTTWSGNHIQFYGNSGNMRQPMASKPRDPAIWDD